MSSMEVGMYRQEVGMSLQVGVSTGVGLSPLVEGM